MSAEAGGAVATGGTVVGLALWAQRAGWFATAIGGGAAASYYKGQADGVARKADQAALELEQQKTALAEEQARLAEIKLQSAELARRRAELDQGFEIDPTIMVAALAFIAAGAMFWYAGNERKKAKRAEEERRIMSSRQRS